MSEEIQRFDIFMVSPDPTKGSEIKKTRLCIIISPNEMNRNIRTVIIAPLTSTQRKYPSRVQTTFQGKRGQVVLDQIRTVDKIRLVKKMGVLSGIQQESVLNVLQELFAK